MHCFSEPPNRNLHVVFRKEREMFRAQVEQALRHPKKKSLNHTVLSDAEYHSGQVSHMVSHVTCGAVCPHAVVLVTRTASCAVAQPVLQV